MVTSCHKDSSVRHTAFRPRVPAAAATRTIAMPATARRTHDRLVDSRAVQRKRSSRKAQETANARPTNGKNIRWSLVTPASGRSEVGSRARKNHRMPKAIGLVLRGETAPSLANGELLTSGELPSRL